MLLFLFVLRLLIHGASRPQHSPGRRISPSHPNALSGLAFEPYFLHRCSLHRVLLLKHSFSFSQVVGKYLLSPDSVPTPDGHYTASLSIRSGHGTASHDRVFRFVPQFRSAQAAVAYAMEQGLCLLRQPGLPA